MKNFILAFTACFITAALSAQDVRLNDSVIFINNKPVALYTKQLSKSPQRYNMEVYGFNDYELIKAEVIKFNAPVAELKPFYYYELTFPPTADTFAIYIEDEAYPLVLAKIIRDYDLISKNDLNKKNVSRFIHEYYGGPALVAKIKSFEDYLNETRFFNEQVVRDRTKPVTIINDRVIMQDGAKIGLIVQEQNSSMIREPYVPDVTFYDSSRIGLTKRVVNNEVVKTTSETQILLYESNRRIDNLRYYKSWNLKEYYDKSEKQKTAAERNLYQVSKEAYKKNAVYSDYRLMLVCYLIENYAL